MDNIRPIPSNVQQIDILFDFSEELDVLRRRMDVLAPGEVEDESLRSIITLLVTDVFDTTTDFAVQSAFDTVIEHLRSIIATTYDVEELREIIRSVDGTIAQKAFMHVPNFGADWYVGSTTTRFVSDTHCVLSTAATIATITGNPGAGGN